MGENISGLGNIFKHFNYLISVREEVKQFEIATDVIEFDGSYFYRLEQFGNFNFGWSCDHVYWDPLKPTFISDKADNYAQLSEKHAGDLLMRMQKEVRQTIKLIKAKKLQLEEDLELDRLYKMALGPQALFYSFTTDESLPVTMPSASPEDF